MAFQIRNKNRFPVTITALKKNTLKYDIVHAWTLNVGNMERPEIDLAVKFDTAGSDAVSKYLFRKIVNSIFNSQIIRIFNILLIFISITTFR